MRFFVLLALPFGWADDFGTNSLALALRGAWGPSPSSPPPKEVNRRCDVLAQLDMGEVDACAYIG